MAIGIMLNRRIQALHFIFMTIGYVAFKPPGLYVRNRESPLSAIKDIN